MDFTITPVDTDTATALRMDIAGGRVAAERVVLDEPGAPCRQCLRPGEVGELMVLFTYQPFRGDSPYAVPSPIYLHADPCTSYDRVTEVPPIARPGLRTVRSYDAGHRLLDGEVVPGAEIEATIGQLLDDDRAAYLHVHSATAGCFTCRVDRAA
jgi:hypothetical protein